MMRALFVVLSLFITACTPSPGAGAADGNAGSAESEYTYPDAERGTHIDRYGEVDVADPYRWLEDADAPTTRAWIDAQNALTFGHLDQLPQREPLRRRLEQLQDYEKFGLPFKQGERYFYTLNDGLQNQSVLFVADTLDGEARVLLDPNTLSEDGTVAVDRYAVTHDGRLLAYAVADGGSDWRSYHVRDIETGQDLPDVVPWVKFSGASWDGEGRGFYYTHYPAPQDESARLSDANYGSQVRYHALGTDAAVDPVVFERPDHPDWLLGGTVSHDGRYLVISVRPGSSSENSIAYRDLATPDAPIVELLGFDARSRFIAHVDGRFIVQTDLEAPRQRVVSIDLVRPEPEHWIELIPEAAEALRATTWVGEQLLAVYLEDATSVVRVFEPDGTPAGEIELPGLGSAAGFAGRPGDPEAFFTYQSFTEPPAIWHYDTATGERTLFRQPHVDFDSERYVTQRIFYESRDGTRVPMFLSHRRGLVPDGSHPTLLYGYGGFNIAQTPRFSVSKAVWLEMGGVYAVACLRGGGEYGDEWHQAGTRTNKQNVFDDFIAAAEWLIDEGYTTNEKLAISGRSNGGLLVGAVLNQRPDLFGAALPAVGVMDMLRFDQFTIGWAWRSDYGLPADPTEFAVLRAYSPYHNVRSDVPYPPTLVTTADRDDRVVPAHSYKYAAALQYAQSGSAPVLIRIETRAGHGAGKPVHMRIEETADEWAFAADALGMQLPEWPEE